MYPPASGANNIMLHVVSVGFVLAAEPISGRFDAIYLLEILMPEPAADKGQKPLFHSPIHCSPPFRNSGLSWMLPKTFVEPSIFSQSHSMGNLSSDELYKAKPANAS